jgi:GUN4-like/TIR domain
MSVTVFFSYSHKDEALRDKLSEHLSILKRNQVIQDWHDRQIGAGAEWATEIDTNLNAADIILLLISSSFLNSEYCWGNELQQAMKRHEAGEACVIPVILRPVDWQGAIFGKLQAFPKDARPVTLWENEDAALMNVAQGIRTAAERIAQQKQAQRPALQILQGSSLPTDSKTQHIKESGQGELHYRQEVLHCVREDGGEISVMSRVFLDGLRSSLALSPQQVASIEQSVLHPFQTYAQTWEGMAKQQYPLAEATQARLKRLQATLSLSDQDVAMVEQWILGELHSEKEINYLPLRDMLKSGKWQDADRETLRVMCVATGRQEAGWLREEDVQQFPCQDLRTIDQLWVKYSEGKFGFSVQKQIWQDCGSPMECDTNWEYFGDHVGWFVEEEWIDYPRDVTFSTSAFYGHLPWFCLVFGGVGGCCGVLGLVLFSRAETCGL